MSAAIVNNRGAVNIQAPLVSMSKAKQRNYNYNIANNVRHIITQSSVSYRGWCENKRLAPSQFFPSHVPDVFYLQSRPHREDLRPSWRPRRGHHPAGVRASERKTVRSMNRGAVALM